MNESSFLYILFSHKIVFSDCIIFMFSPKREREKKTFSAFCVEPAAAERSSIKEEANFNFFRSSLLQRGNCSLAWSPKSIMKVMFEWCSTLLEPLKNVPSSETQVVSAKVNASIYQISPQQWREKSVWWSARNRQWMHKPKLGFILPRK